MTINREMEVHVTSSGQSTEPEAAPPVQPAEPQTRRDEPSTLSVEEVRSAIEHDRFVVFSQPIQDLRTGAVASEELLVRMKMPDGQLVAPFAFLPTAEAFGLSLEIDAMMVGKGLDLAARGRRVAVNLSAHSLTDPGLTERVEKAVHDGMDPRNLTFEVSEDSAGTDLDAAKALATRLTQIGCDLAIDEFGVGFASLVFVKHLPAQMIKVGREFVGDLPRSLDDYHVMGCIVDLAAKLGRKTAAVGVEDGLTLELLKRLGVDYAQGFFIGRPREVDFDKPRDVEPAAVAEVEN
jgi:EAL domain-containing protein (putative c-di-GMP-specific phosphodiesterase class I)